MKDKSRKITEELTITKYKNREDYLKGKSYEQTKEICESGINCLLNAGITRIWNLVCGLNTLHYDSGNAQIGVGDGDAAALPAQTDLQGANKTWVTMDDGYPSVSDQTATWQGIFTGASGNHAWKECAVRQGIDTTPLINRVVTDKGTKVEGEIWTSKLQITLS